MNTKIDDSMLMDLVFTNLCRVLKNKKIYHKFRCFIGVFGKSNHNHDLTTSIYSTMKCMQPYINAAKQGDNPFCHAYDKASVFNILIQMLGNDNMITKENNNDVGMVQMRITQLLNTLLHSCVEKFIQNFSEIENIGRETFEMTCKGIYGDNFVDETEKNIPKNVKALMDAQREFIKGNGMADIRELASDTRFVEFLKQKGILDENGRRRRRQMSMMPPPTMNDWFHSTDFEELDDDFQIGF